MTTYAPGVFQQLTSALRRRWRSVAISFLATISIAAAIAFLWPPTYVSTGTILIEQQEVPEEMVQSTISSYANQRIQLINQRVMTTDNLLRIVQKYDLYSKERKTMGREAILDMIRNAITFKTIDADVIDPRMGRAVQATIAFSLSFTHSDANTAARVANELTTLYLQENLDSRKRMTDQTATFMLDEGDKLSKRIAELEGKLATFKEQQFNNLPELVSLNLSLVNRADDERSDVDTRLRSLDQQIVFLDSQLAQISKTASVYTSTGERVMSPGDRLKVLRAEYARVAALYSPDHPDVLRIKREMDGLSANAGDTGRASDRIRQLQQAEIELASARERYSAEHPDVRRLERLVASLRAADAGAATQPPFTAEDADNPAYIQLRAQREALSSEQQALQGKRISLSGRIGELERRLDRSPGVERDYATLVRELDSSQIKYREIRQKHMAAQLAQSLETERKGERFSLIDPPLAPEEPTSPNRKLLLAVGSLLALLLSAGIVYLLETIDHSVRGRHDVVRLLEVPPLAVIPWLQNTADIARTRLRVKIAVVGTTTAMVAMVMATHFLYRPLDVLWAVVMRRIGG